MSDQRVEPIDGRVARRERNRDAVLDAVLELFAEDSLAPGAAEVAERAGLSLRSVYRYFEDSDALLRAAIARNMETVRPRFALAGVGEGPLVDRVERIVDNRVGRYEDAAPLMRAALRRAPDNELIREALEDFLRFLRRQVEAMFEPELSVLAPAARRDVGATVDVLLGFHSIEHLRRTRGFTGPECRRALTTSVVTLLTVAPPAAPATPTPSP